MGTLSQRHKTFIRWFKHIFIVSREMLVGSLVRFYHMLYHTHMYINYTIYIIFMYCINYHIFNSFLIFFFKMSIIYLFFIF